MVLRGGDPEGRVTEEELAKYAFRLAVRLDILLVLTDRAPQPKHTLLTPDQYRRVREVARRLNVDTSLPPW